MNRKLPGYLDVVAKHIFNNVLILYEGLSNFKFHISFLFVSGKHLYKNYGDRKNGGYLPQTIIHNWFLMKQR